MTLELWYEKGMTFEQYRMNMQVNQQELTRVYEQVVFSEEDQNTWNDAAERNWRGIVLTADWCGDAALCVPVLQRIAEASKIELRFLIRDENLELMDQYLTNGTSRSIPIFIFIDQDGNEKKVWGPRSSEVQEMVTALRAELPAADSPDFQEKQKNMYRQFKERITSDPSVWRTVIESVKAKVQE
ncbi:thioredoxin family protein [Aneurinibacillus uraniidurans]|uniref:thioredoxin family protein n=1 Tax=Aneurinibacillus uraniidurans TaxID=2966586 RepID=UPI00234B0BD7|nr:thioredoxin family protein [Aneurinibacillus sp. B1]WCN37456.1 thioredoxin family protein [Aneurinibacillus sp. B1]